MVIKRIPFFLRAATRNFAATPSWTSPLAGAVAFYKMSTSDSPQEIQPLEQPHDTNSDLDDATTTTNKRIRASEVWEYFAKIDWDNNSETKVARCIVRNCKHKPFLCGKEGSTRTLWRHLELAHRTQYSKTKEYLKKQKKLKPNNPSLEKMWNMVSFH